MDEVIIYDGKPLIGSILVAQGGENIGIYKINMLDGPTDNKGAYTLKFKCFHHSEQSQLRYDSIDFWINLTGPQFKTLIKGHKITYNGHGHLGFAFWDEMQIEITNEDCTAYFL
jgi:hypothetical protein